MGDQAVPERPLPQSPSDKKDRPVRKGRRALLLALAGAAVTAFVTSFFTEGGKDVWKRAFGQQQIRPSDREVHGASPALTEKDTRAPLLLTSNPLEGGETRAGEEQAVILTFDEPLKECAIGGISAVLRNPRVAEATLRAPTETGPWALRWNATDTAGNATGTQVLSLSVLPRTVLVTFDTTLSMDAGTVSVELSIGQDKLVKGWKGMAGDPAITRTPSIELERGKQYTLRLTAAQAGKVGVNISGMVEVSARTADQSEVLGRSQFPFAWGGSAQPWVDSVNFVVPR